MSTGSNQNITLPSVALLTGSASDDGLPSSLLTTTWEKLSGPGSVTFGDASQLSTTATFSIAGSYTLRLTADDGELTNFSDVDITVNPQVGYAVQSLTLINADTDLPISGWNPISNGATLNLATLPTANLNIRADTVGTIGSVRFGLDGNANFHTENVVPYALFGDGGGDYAAGSFDIGSHTITATPFSASGGNGVPGGTWTIEFTVIDDPAAAGDYNDDGLVNAADYGVWVSTFGSTTQLAADGNRNQVIDAGDYTIWRDHEGTTLPSTIVAAAANTSDTAALGTEFHAIATISSSTSAKVSRAAVAAVSAMAESVTASETAAIVSAPRSQIISMPTPQHSVRRLKALSTQSSLRPPRDVAFASTEQWRELEIASDLAQTLAPSMDHGNIENRGISDRPDLTARRLSFRLPAGPSLTVEAAPDALGDRFDQRESGA